MSSLFDGLHSTVGAAQAAPINALGGAVNLNGDVVPVVVQAQSQEQRNLFDDAVILNVSFSCFGTSRKLKKSEYEVDASKDKTSAQKGICQSAELTRIKKFDSETRQLIEARTLPSQFKAGLYLLKIIGIEDIDSLLSERGPIRENLVEQFISVYPELKRRDSLPKEQGGLGSLYKDKDYPSIAVVREAFAMTHSYSEFSAPGSLRSVNMAIYERERLKAQGIWHNAIEMGEQLLVSEFVALVDHMRERLTPGTGDTKPKKFKDTLVTNARDFLASFDARDISQNERLRAAVQEMASMLEGVTPADLRKNETIQARVRADIERIKRAIDPLVTTGLARRIDLEAVEEWGDL